MTDVGAFHHDARELRGALEQIRHHRLRRVVADDDRREQVAHRPTCLDLRRDLVEGHARHARELVQLVVAVPVDLRQVVQPELDRGGGGVRDEHFPVPVENRPARSLDAHDPELICLCLRDIPRSGEDLERPEPEQQRREDDEDDAAEQRDPPRELGREAIGLDPLLALTPGWARTTRRRRGRNARPANQATAPLSPARPEIGRSQQPANGRVDERREDEVHHDRRNETAEDGAGRRGVSEHEVDDDEPERVEDGDDRDRQDRGVRPVASRRLPVPADPVAGDREHE